MDRWCTFESIASNPIRSINAKQVVSKYSVYVLLQNMHIVSLVVQSLIQFCANILWWHLHELQQSRQANEIYVTWTLVVLCGSLWTPKEKHQTYTTFYFALDLVGHIYVLHASRLLLSIYTCPYGVVSVWIVHSDANGLHKIQKVSWTLMYSQSITQAFYYILVCLESTNSFYTTAHPHIQTVVDHIHQCQCSVACCCVECLVGHKFWTAYGLS